MSELIQLELPGGHLIAVIVPSTSTVADLISTVLREEEELIRRQFGSDLDSTSFAVRRVIDSGVNREWTADEWSHAHDSKSRELGSGE